MGELQGNLAADEDVKERLFGIKRAFYCTFKLIFLLIYDCTIV